MPAIFPADQVQACGVAGGSEAPRRGQQRIVAVQANEQMPAGIGSAGPGDKHAQDIDIVVFHDRHGAGDIAKRLARPRERGQTSAARDDVIRRPQPAKGAAIAVHHGLPKRRLIPGGEAAHDRIVTQGEEDRLGCEAMKEAGVAEIIEREAGEELTPWPLGIQESMRRASRQPCALLTAPRQGRSSTLGQTRRIVFHLPDRRPRRRHTCVSPK